MPNPYEELFEDSDQKKPETPADPPAARPELQPPAPEDTVEPLDSILHKIEAFQSQGEQFSIFLSKTRAVDHREEANTERPLLSLFFVVNDDHDKSSLASEKAHYNLLQGKFRIAGHQPRDRLSLLNELVLDD